MNIPRFKQISDNKTESKIDNVSRVPDFPGRDNIFSFNGHRYNIFRGCTDDEQSKSKRKYVAIVIVNSGAIIAHYNYVVYKYFVYNARISALNVYTADHYKYYQHHPKNMVNINNHSNNDHIYQNQ